MSDFKKNSRRPIDTWRHYTACKMLLHPEVVAPDGEQKNQDAVLPRDQAVEVV